jgi:hypothetical protein
MFNLVLDLMLSKEELYIVGRFRENSRLKANSLTGFVGRSPATVGKMVSTLGTVMRRFYSVLDYSRLGYSVRVLVFLKPRINSRDELITHLSSSININCLQRTTSGFFIEGLFRNVADSHDFLETLNCYCSKVEIYYQVDELKSEGFFCDLSEDDLDNISENS